MKILMCHNSYREPGGEDVVFAAEAALLESHGHHVIRYQRHNSELDSMNKFELLGKTIWNRRTTSDLTKIIGSERPDILHCANTFPLISPSVYHVAKAHGLGVVQTLHNYRLVCPKATLFRNGRICETCLGKTFAWPAILHSCYHDSVAQTAAISAMLTFHRMKRTWSEYVDKYIALTESFRKKLIAGGLPEDKIVVKPNFLPDDPGEGAGGGNFAIYVGRILPEKGIETLIDAWRQLPIDLELKILGDGPLAKSLISATSGDNRISWLGHQDKLTVYSLLGDAKFLVMPSKWHEPFGLSMIEAFSKGTPVIASKRGAMEEIVKNGENGFLVEPGNARQLAETVQAALSDPNRLTEMREAARREFTVNYSSSTNYSKIISIYQKAIG